MIFVCRKKLISPLSLSIIYPTNFKLIYTKDTLKM